MMAYLAPCMVDGNFSRAAPTPASPLSSVTHSWRLRGFQPFLSAPQRRSSRGRQLQICAGLGFGKPAPIIKQTAPKTCPCGSGKNYQECCKQYHDGSLPETPETLMRARYSAYAKGVVDFVVKTTHPDNPLKPNDPDSQLVADVRATCDKIGWEKLKVLSTEEGGSPDEAFVTFQTWFKVVKQQGKRQKGSFTQTFVERSRFLRDPERGWLYVDGTQDWDPK